MTAAVPRSAAVVGGGIVGLSTGLALQARGLAVTVFDAPADRPSASHGNAGHIAVEQHEPLRRADAARRLKDRELAPGQPRRQRKAGERAEKAEGAFAAAEDHRCRVFKMRASCNADHLDRDHHHGLAGNSTGSSARCSGAILDLVGGGLDRTSLDRRTSRRIPRKSRSRRDRLDGWTSWLLA